MFKNYITYDSVKVFNNNARKNLYWELGRD